ncbi:hypothetical protein BG015_004371 [Linnemannia schmuckeri]|uniref:Kazal-like domain-containing protein n=1 Tax=Linnemannia schmuckeri TaxID=64567 RepID=A0A9P5UZV6_9FUNG|nr:hypothetical protein BG015_004371 [Linnemannia schmuckeri]
MQFSTLITLTVATSMAVLSAMAAPAVPKCGTICPAVYQPVCAKAIDGLNKVFGNACELKNYNCKHPNANFVAVADSECKDFVAVDKRAAAAAPKCDTVCPTIYQPVCAKIQSGKSQTFGNTCELDVYKCEHPTEKVELLASADCAAAAPACAIACPAVYKPVCAKYPNGDLQTFGNRCEMGVFNCKNPAITFSLVTEGDCDVN